MTHTHRPRKRFGQNFLVDRNIIQRIIHAIKPQLQDHLVEIGPGLGALTRQLLNSVQTLDVIEIDRDLVAKLNTEFKDSNTLNIHQADALDFDFTSLTPSSLRGAKRQSNPEQSTSSGLLRYARNDGASPLRIIGNLPYNISTPLLFHLLDQIEVIEDIHVMLQKEVVKRIAATSGTHAYGRLSVMIQYYCQATPLFDVAASAFSPAPKVDSAVIRLTPHKKMPIVAENMTVFADIVRQAFNHRRKTIRNCLKNTIDEATLATLGIDPKLRPEQLSIKQFVAISNAIME